MGSVGKRKAERRGCQVKAQVIRPDGSDPIDCLILDFSATGARVKLNAQAELPARFKLYIPSRPETKSVILRWTKGLEFGVEYSTGVADEKTFFELIDRVAKLEKAGGSGDDADALAELARRIEALESRLQSAPDALPAEEGCAADIDEGAVAALRRQIDKVSKAAEGGVKRSEQFLSTRMDQTEERLRALLAPDVAERLARLEAMVEAGALAQPAPSPEADAGGPDPRIVSRIADLEAKLMSAPRMSGGFDPSALEGKIEQVARRAAEHAERVERFLMTRIDNIETQMIAAPSAPAPTRSSEIAAVELKLHELAARFEREAAEPLPVAALASAPGDFAGLAERVSDLEMSVMELRLDQPTAQGAGDMDLHRRIVEIEGRHAEIIGTLRNLLALLSAGEGRRAAG